jgi:hypothetical protein
MEEFEETNPFSLRVPFCFFRHFSLVTSLSLQVCRSTPEFYFGQTKTYLLSSPNSWGPHPFITCGWLRNPKNQLL